MPDKPSIIPPGARVLDDQEQRALLEEMAEIVAKSHLFKSLDQDGQTRVLTSGYVCTYRSGDDLMRQGEPGNTMYLLLNGTVTVHTETDGHDMHLAELGRAACVGEVSVLTGSDRTATVTAATDVNAVGFDKHRIQRILQDYPKVRELLETLVEGRARNTIEKIVGS